MQQLTGQFTPGAITGIGGFQLANLSDNETGVQTWSKGAQSVASVGAQPTIIKPWTIYGFAMQGHGAHVSGGLPVYGHLGALFGALLTGGTFTPQNNQPFVFPQNGGPNILPLWDGSQDPPFPMFDGVHLSPGGYWQGSLQLPQPLKLAAGDQIAMALWLTPSLTSEVETVIYQAGWTVSYDY